MDAEAPARETLAYRTWVDYKAKTEDVALAYRGQLAAIEARFSEAQKAFDAARKLRDAEADEARDRYLKATAGARAQRQAVLKESGGEPHAAIQPRAFRP